MTDTINNISRPTVERVNPVGMAEIPGIHHVVVTHGGATVHIGGQVALTPDGEIAGDDLGSQTRQAAHNLLTCLTAVGATPADLVRVRAFVVGLTGEDVAVFEEGVLDVLEGWTGPAATLIGVHSLFVPGLLVEIEAEAVVETADTRV